MENHIQDKQCAQQQKKEPIPRSYQSSQQCRHTLHLTYSYPFGSVIVSDLSRLRGLGGPLLLRVIGKLPCIQGRSLHLQAWIDGLVVGIHVGILLFGEGVILMLIWRLAQATLNML